MSGCVVLALGAPTRTLTLRNTPGSHRGDGGGGDWRAAAPARRPRRCHPGHRPEGGGRDAAVCPPPSPTPPPSPSACPSVHPSSPPPAPARQEGRPGDSRSGTARTPPPPGAAGAALRGAARPDRPAAAAAALTCWGRGCRSPRSTRSSCPGARCTPSASPRPGWKPPAPAPRAALTGGEAGTAAAGGGRGRSRGWGAASSPPPRTAPAGRAERSGAAAVRCRGGLAAAVRWRRRRRGGGLAGEARPRSPHRPPRGEQRSGAPWRPALGAHGCRLFRREARSRCKAPVGTAVARVGGSLSFTRQPGGPPRHQPCVGPAWGRAGRGAGVGPPQPRLPSLREKPRWGRSRPAVSGGGVGTSARLRTTPAVLFAGEDGAHSAVAVGDTEHGGRSAAPSRPPLQASSPGAGSSSGAWARFLCPSSTGWSGVVLPQ